MLVQERLTSAIKAIRFNVTESTIREFVLASGQCFKQGVGLGGAEIDKAIKDGLPGPGESKLEREFPFMKPRCWVHKDKKARAQKGYFKVLPWFQPLDNESRIDFKGLMKDLAPDLFTKDVMANVEFFSGLISFCGYQIYNDGGMWLCMEPHGKKFFKDLGEWDEAKYGKPVPVLPVTESGIERKKAHDAAAKAKKKTRKKK